MRSSVVLALGLATALTAQEPSAVDWHQGADGRVVASGSGYHANFEAGWFRYHSLRGENGSLPTLGLRFVGARRANWRSPCADAPVPMRAADRVRIAHEGIVENYLVGKRTVEQTFTIASRPAGSGDLVLEIEVGGNVHCRPVAAEHRALEFQCVDAPAIRYGEAIAFARDRSARVEVATRFDGGRKLELIVPAAFVDSASYPVVIDPVVGSLFAPGGTTNADSQPAVAWSSDFDRWCVVWRRDLAGPNQQILARIYDREATPLTGEITIALGPEQLWPEVALCNRFSDDAFLIVWSGNRQILGRVLHSTGAWLAPQFFISSPLAGEWDKAPSVSGPGDGVMMVAWPRAHVGEFDPRSVMLCHVRFPNPAQVNLVSVGPEETIETAPSGNVLGVRLAGNDIVRTVAGVDWFANRLVWSRFYPAPTPGDHDVRTASFRMRLFPYAFQVIDAPGDVPGSANIGPNERQPDIAMIARDHDSEADLRYLVVWNDEGDIRGHRMDLDGTVGAGIAIKEGAGIRREPSIGTGACEFTVGYFDEIAVGDTELRVARVLLDGTVPVDDVLVDAPDTQLYLANLSQRPVPSGGGSTRNHTLVTWVRPTFANPGAFHIGAQFFEPIRPTLTPFGMGCPGPNGELPAIYMSPNSDGAFPGNLDFQVAVTDAPPFSLAALVISDQFTTTAIPGAPGCALYAGLPWLTVLPTVTFGTGGGVVDLPLPCGLPSGSALAFQWVIYSPAANAFGWISSDDLDVVWSHF